MTSVQLVDVSGLVPPDNATPTDPTRINALENAVLRNAGGIFAFRSALSSVSTPSCAAISDFSQLEGCFHQSVAEYAASQGIALHSVLAGVTSGGSLKLYYLATPFPRLADVEVCVGINTFYGSAWTFISPAFPGSVTLTIPASGVAAGVVCSAPIPVRLGGVSVTEVATPGWRVSGVSTDPGSAFTAYDPQSQTATFLAVGLVQVTFTNVPSSG